MTSTVSTSRPDPGAARRILFVLTLVNLFNYIDRFVVPGIAVSLKQSSLGITDTQLGLLTTAFILVYSFASPKFGELGDRKNRPRLVALGVAIWSVASIGAGFAWSFLSLFVARATLGVGEAAYGSIAPSILADAFPARRRGRVLAVFFAAIPIGSAIGYIVAGVVDKHFGWRAAFWIAGVPSLLLAALLLRLPELPRRDDAGDIAPAGAGQGRLAVYRGLLANRNYLYTVLGYAMYTFAIGALAVWMPSFLTRVHGIAKETAALQVGAIAVVTGFVGTFGGGWLGDYLLRYTRHAYLFLSGVTTLMAVPFVVLTLTAHDPHIFLGALVAAELLMFASTGPINSAILNYVAPGERATAMAFSILLIHILGDAPSPTIVGWLSDAARTRGLADGPALQRALLILPVAVVVSGGLWVWGAIRSKSE